MLPIDWVAFKTVVNEALLTCTGTSLKLHPGKKRESVFNKMISLLTPLVYELDFD